MSALKILGGDFKSGLAEFNGACIKLRGARGAEELHLSLVAEVKKVGGETHVDGSGTFKTAAVGSVIGGIAAGAAAGGITGPVGALIGACAGAVLTSRKHYPVSVVSLRDGRHFTATAREGEWIAFIEAIRRAPPLALQIAVIQESPIEPANSEGRGLISQLKRTLGRSHREGGAG